MKRLLYVDCCIRGSQSRTRRLAEAFLGALPPTWKTEILNLPEEGLPYFPARISSNGRTCWPPEIGSTPVSDTPGNSPGQTPLYWLPRSGT